MTENNNNLQYDALTDWKQEPSQADLFKDLQAAKSSHSIFLGNLDRYREDYDGGPEIRARVGKSKARPQLIRKHLEWKFPALEEPFLNTEDMYQVKPRTAEDEAAAIQNALMLNYYWATKIDKVHVVGTAVRTFGIEGTVIVKTGWNAVSEDIEVQVPEPIYATPDQSLAVMERAVQSGQMSPEQAQAMIESGEPMQVGTKMVTKIENRVIENHPTYEVCDNTDVIIDPTCNGVVADAQFIIHQYELDMSTLLKQKVKTNPETGVETGIYKNLEYIDFEQDQGSTNEYETDSKSSFIFADKARKKVQVYEYWGFWDVDGSGETIPIVATWIGDVMVRLEENPFAHGELPFSLAKYMPVKNELYGEPDGALLRENQESIGKMTRAAHDITSTQAIGQTLINEQFFTSPSQWDAYKKGNDAKFRAGMDPKTAIHKMNVEPINNSLFQMIELKSTEAEALTGTDTSSGSGSGALLGASATGIRSALDARSKRELSILRRLADQLFKDMARKTIINMQAYASEEETIRITNGDYVSVRRDDLKGEFDLIVDVSTPEKDNETAERLNMLMQTNAASMHPEMSKLIYAKIARLWKQPDLAEEMTEFVPQPDPMEEKIKQMQMDNMVLEQQKLQMEIAVLAKSLEESDSKIDERTTRANENEVDIRNKNAQATLREAQAAKLASEGDILDAKFIEDQTGITRQRELDDAQHKADLDEEKDLRKYEAEVQKQNTKDSNGNV